MRTIRSCFCRGVAVVALVTAVAVTALDAQVVRQPETVAIHGRIVAAETGAPIPYARVRVTEAQLFVRTDIDGSFNLMVPRSGAIAVTKAGFAPLEQKLPLSAGEVEIRLPRAAALSGRVVDELGEPIVGANVRASAPGVRQSPALSATTDDHGHYRLGGLVPAAYRVSVETLGADSSPDPALVATLPGTPPNITAYQLTTNTTHFPDTLDPARAIDIPLGEADERNDIDFHLPGARASRQPFIVTTSLPRLADRRIAEADAGVIRGTIVDPQGRPLPHAQVTLDGNAFPSAGVTDAAPILSVFRTAPADERGVYEFSGLRPGAYSVEAAKAGYSPAPVRGRPFLGLRPLRAGEVRVQDVTLVPWGAVSGRLRDEFGDPVQGARITLLQSRYERGGRRLVEARVSARTTDDRGEFRLFAVPPGEYVVTASVAGDAAAALTGYAQTFYPGTPSGREARPVSLDAGSDVGGLEFALSAMPTARVSGITLDASGKPTTQLRLALVSRAGVDAPLGAVIDADGTFVFENVTPGPYILTADAGRTNTFTEGAFVALPVSVGPTGLADVRVQALAGSTITGRLLFDRFVRTADPPPTAVTITALPDDFDLAPAAFASTQANAEGVFQLRGVSGQRRIQVTRVPAQYMVKTVLVNGRDVTDEPIPFGHPNQSVENVEVVLTDRVTQLTGVITDAQASIRPGMHVVVFSTDRGRWYPSSRYLRHALTGDDGRVTFTGLPVGSYFAVVLTAVPEGEDAWQDPAFLELVRNQATVTSVSDGGTDTITLRVPNQ